MKFVLALLATCSFIAAGYSAADLSFEELNALVQKKSALIVDVNGAASYASGHVPGAVNFFASNFEATLPKDKATAIVVYCGSLECGAWRKAATRVEELGYTNVKHFAPGIKGWKEAGGAVEQGATDGGAM